MRVSKSERATRNILVESESDEQRSDFCAADSGKIPPGAAELHGYRVPFLFQGLMIAPEGLQHPDPIQNRRTLVASGAIQLI